MVQIYILKCTNFKSLYYGVYKGFGTKGTFFLYIIKKKNNNKKENSNIL